MAFVKANTNPGGSPSLVHACIHLAGSAEGLTVLVRSYETPEAYEARSENWEAFYAIPSSAQADPQSWLISEEGPFAGGARLADTLPLQRLQDEKWAEIKATRDALEASGFMSLGQMVDRASKSTQRMAMAVQAAQGWDEEAAGKPFSVDWTTQDNGVLHLTAAEMVAMPIALALYADGLHAKARAVRSQIYADDATDLSVGAVRWPEEG